jgi:hypothetical protein
VDTAHSGNVTNPPESEPVQLAYAVRPPRLGRRCRQAAAALLAIAILAVLAYARGPWFWSRTQFLYWQDRCLDFRAPAGQVVYEERNDSLAPLPAGVGLEHSALHYAANSGGSLVRTPACWRTLRARLGPEALDDPGEPRAILFMHERRSPAGVRRLVVIRAPGPIPVAPWGAVFNGRYARLDDSVLLLDPASLSREAKLHSDSASRWGVSPRPLTSCQQARSIRLFAGHPDEDDASHFTVVYEIDGRRGTIDGWLRDLPAPPRLLLAPDADGDGISDAGLVRLPSDVVSVEFSVRDGPLRQGVPS